MSARMSPEEVAELVRYDPQTGGLFWKPRGPEHFNSATRGQALSRAWAKHYADRPALTDVSRDGYMRGMVRGVYLQAHRVCWAVLTGEWPVQDIDHINGVRTDNRAVNLRVVSRAENSRNQKIRSTNTSGHMGVYWSKRHDRWIVYVNRVYVGLFHDFDEACRARKAAQDRLGFHPNHGRTQ